MRYKAIESKNFCFWVAVRVHVPKTKSQGASSARRAPGPHREKTRLDRVSFGLPGRLDAVGEGATVSGTRRRSFVRHVDGRGREPAAVRRCRRDALTRSRRPPSRPSDGGRSSPSRHRYRPSSPAEREGKAVGRTIGPVAASPPRNVRLRDGPERGPHPPSLDPLRLGEEARTRSPTEATTPSRGRREAVRTPPTAGVACGSAAARRSPRGDLVLHAPESFDRPPAPWYRGRPGPHPPRRGRIRR